MRRGIVRLGWAILLLTVTGLFLAVGLSLWVWALYEALRAAFGVAASAAISGLAAFVVSGGGAWFVRRLTV